MDKSIFVQYNTEEERIAALRKMVGLRKEWEEHVRQLVAQRKQSFAD